MKVIIVEDDFIVADHLGMMLKKQGIQVLGIIDNVDEAITASSLKPDLYFVDIRLEGKKTGIDLAVALQEKKIPFAFVSANNELTTLKKAVNTSPVAYITKPYKETDIIALLEIFKSNTQQTVIVSTRYGKKPIKISKINYVEADGSYSKIVTDQEEFRERLSLADFEKQFQEMFVRTHRSFLVNKEKAEEINSNAIYVNGKEIPISRSYSSEIKKLLAAKN